MCQASAKLRNTSLRLDDGDTENTLLIRRINVTAQVRFFTEAPDASTNSSDSNAEARALAEEQRRYGDLVILDMDRGMNFAAKLVSAMRFLSVRYTFDFFLRLDDDYFLCLNRLVSELNAIKSTPIIEITGANSHAKPYTENAREKVDGAQLGKDAQDLPSPQLFYAGYRYCQPGRTRIDEAYLLLSGQLVYRVLSSPNLMCSRHAGVSAGWWFTNGNSNNPLDDVHVVHDSRLDHRGKWWRSVENGGAPESTYNSVCARYIGVHHTYAMQMSQLWVHANNVSVLPEQGLEKVRAISPWYSDDNCPSTAAGVGDKQFAGDGAQACEGFQSGGVIHCGAEGCPNKSQ